MHPFAPRNLVARFSAALRVLAVVLALAVSALTVLAPATGQCADVSLPSVQLHAVDAAWTAFAQAEAGSEEQARLFEQFRSHAAEVGVLELDSHAVALLLEAAAALDAGDSARATIALDYASELAPMLPQVEFLSAHAARVAAPWRLDRVLSHAGRGLARMSESPTGRAAVRAQAIACALMLAALFAVLFAGTVVVRHGSRVAHDLRLLLRRGPTLSHASALVALAVVIPALLWWSPQLFVTCALIVVSAHLAWKERVVALLLLALAVAAPSLALRIGVLTEQSLVDRTDYTGAVAARCGTQCVEHLDASIAAGDERSRVARAWVHYKTGTEDQHRRALTLLDEATLSPDVLASAALLRGNVLFANGDLEGAATRFEESRDAAQSRTQRAAALVNLYRVEVAQGHQGTAQQVAADAEQTAGDFVRDYFSYQGTSQNRLLAISPLAPRPVTVDADSTIARSLASRRLAPWLGSVPVGWGLVGLVVAAICVLLGGWAQRRQLVSQRCTRCATPVSRFVLAPAFEAKLCVLCYQLEVARDGLRAPQIFAREERIADWRESAPRLVRIANAAAPGAGLLSAGWTLTGAGVLALFCGGVALLVVPQAATQMALSVRPELAVDGANWVAGGGILLAYVLAFALSGRAGRIVSLDGASDEAPAERPKATDSGSGRARAGGKPRAGSSAVPRAGSSAVPRAGSSAVPRTGGAGRSGKGPGARRTS